MILPRFSPGYGLIGRPPGGHTAVARLFFYCTLDARGDRFPRRSGDVRGEPSLPRGADDGVSVLSAQVVMVMGWRLADELTRLIPSFVDRGREKCDFGSVLYWRMVSSVSYYAFIAVVIVRDLYVCTVISIICLIFISRNEFYLLQSKCTDIHSR